VAAWLDRVRGTNAVPTVLAVLARINFKAVLEIFVAADARP
jgi:hypothetical protein